MAALSGQLAARVIGQDLASTRTSRPAAIPGGMVDAISDDGQHGLTIIAFLGSVFSPYYKRSGRGDPLNHSSLNVALYWPRRHAGR